MAITKKTMEQIAKENNIDISEENAQKVADAYIQPTLNALKTAEQQAVADTQTQLKSLENDYFNAYRAGLYNTQSRGLSGGLEMLQESQLRSQLASENSKINNALLQKQAELETNRGTALSNASAYKTDYLNKLLSQVQSLREQDYAQRYQAWIDAQNLALQRAQIAQSARANQLAEEAQKLQNQDYADSYARANLASIYQTYSTMLNSNRVSEAGQYLAKQMAKLQELGYDISGLSTEFNNIRTYEQAQKDLPTYQQAYQDAKNLELGYSLLGFGLGIPTLGIGTAAIQATKGNEARDAQKKYLDLIKKTENTLSNTYIPSYYSDYLGL